MTTAKARERQGQARRHKRWLLRLTLSWRWLLRHQPEVADRIRLKAAREIPDPRFGGDNNL